MMSKSDNGELIGTASTSGLSCAGTADANYARLPLTSSPPTIIPRTLNSFFARRFEELSDLCAMLALTLEQHVAGDVMAERTVFT